MEETFDQAATNYRIACAMRDSAYEDLKIKIRQARKDGMNVSYIARKAGVSRMTVYAILAD